MDADYLADVTISCPTCNEEPSNERKLAIVTPANRVQSYKEDLAPSKSRKYLANWSWVRLDSTRARLTDNNNNRTDQRQWQRPDSNTDDRTLDETGEHVYPNSIEGDAIQSDEEGPDLEELE